MENFKCQKCKALFREKDYLSIHYIEHQFWCYICEIDISDKDSFVAHINDKHRKISNCNGGSEDFDNKNQSNTSNLKKYSSQNKLRETEDIEDINTFRFKARELLPFRCNVCPKRCSSVYFLQKHKLLHKNSLLSKHPNFNKKFDNLLQSAKISETANLPNISSDVQTPMDDTSLKQMSKYISNGNESKPMEVPLVSEESINTSSNSTNSVLNNSMFMSYNPFTTLRLVQNQNIAPDSFNNSPTADGYTVTGNKPFSVPVNMPLNINIPQQSSIQYNADDLIKYIFTFIDICKDLKYPLPPRLFEKVKYFHEELSKRSIKEPQTDEENALKEMFNKLTNIINKQNRAATKKCMKRKKKL